MSLTHFYMDPSGNDLNSGQTQATAADYTSTGGNFDGTSVFTPTDGSTPSSFVNVGDYVSLYNTGDTVSRCVAKVTAVGAGVNGTVTIDTTIKYGTVPTVNSGSRNLKHGGAWASLSINSSANTAMSGAAPQATQVNCKAGTYAKTTTSITMSGAQTTAIPVIYSGYKSSINDQDANLLAVAGTDIPNFTWTTVGLTVTANFTVFRNMAFTSAKTSAAMLIVSSGSNTFVNCQISNTGAGATALALSVSAVQTTFIGCYVTQSSTTGTLAACSTSNSAGFAGCYFKSGQAGVTFTTATSVSVVGCVFDSQQGDALQFTTGYGTISQNTFYAPTGNGINWTGTPQGNAISLVLSNYFEAVNQASKAAINNTLGTNVGVIRCAGNSYFNCTANTSGLGDYPVFFDIGTLASSGCNNPGSDDFTPTSTLKGVGFPAHLPQLTPTNYPTPGAYEAQAGAIFQVES